MGGNGRTSANLMPVNCTAFTHLSVTGYDPQITNINFH